MLFVNIFIADVTGQILKTGESLYSTGDFISYTDSGDIFLSGNLVCNLTIDTFTIYVNNCDSTTVDPQANFYTLKIGSHGDIQWITHSSINNPLSDFLLSGMVTDSLNNVYLAGTFSGSVPLGAAEMNTSSEKEAFVVKRSYDGELKWVLENFCLESTSVCKLKGMKTDINGNPVVFGSFKGKCRFGDDTITAVREQLFVARVEPSGQSELLAYGEALGDSSLSSINDVFVDEYGMLMALHTRDSVVFRGKDSLALLSPADMELKYDYQKDTTVQTDTTQVDSILYDPLTLTYDTLKVDSILYDTIIIDTVYIDTIYHNSSYSYLARLIGDSTFIELDKGYFPGAQGVAADQDDNPHLLINYSDSCVVQNDTLVATGKRDFLIARYQGNGGYDWLRPSWTASSATDLLAKSVVCDKQGYAYIAGRYGDSLRNGAFSLAGHAIDSSQHADGFIIKLQPNGDVVWMQRAGGGSADEVNDLFAVDSIRLLGTGQFNEYIEFGTLSDSSYYGDQNFFAATIDPYPAFDVEMTPASDASVCKGDSMLFSVTDDPAFLYQWQKDGKDIAGAVSPTFYASDSGSYRVLVTDTTLPYTRKTMPVDFTIDPIPVFTIWTNDDTTFCNGEHATLKTESQTDHTYLWHREGNMTSGTSNSFNAYLTGNYSVQVISPEGCDSTSRSIKVTSLPYPSGKITPGETSFCDGDSLDLQAAEGPGFSYRWFDDDQELAEDTNSVLRIKEAGTYSVIVFNRVGCATHSSEYTYNVIPSPGAVLSFVGDSVLCEGERTILTANTGLDFTYKWYKNNEPIPGEAESRIAVSDDGVYSVDVGYLNSCSRRSNYKTVVVNPNPKTPLHIDGETEICEGQASTLSTFLDPNNTYRWYRNGDTLQRASSNHYQVIQSGDYWVEEVNAFGCSSLSPTQRITVKPSPEAPLFHRTDSIFCEGDSVELYTHHFQNYAYYWEKDGERIEEEHNQSMTVKHTGGYRVLVEDLDVNCSSYSRTMQVLEIETPNEMVQADQLLPICKGDTVKLLVSANENWLYQWFRDGSQMYGDTSSFVHANDEGTYQVKITNQSGCIANSSALDLNLKTNPVPRITVSDLFLSTGSYDDLQWNYNGSALSGATDPVYLVEESGSYSVTVYHDNECFADSEPVVVCNPVPGITIKENELTASEGSDFQWYYEGDTIEGATQQKYYVQMSGLYSVDVNNEGCTSRSSQVEVCIPVPFITVNEQDVLEASPGQNFQWYSDTSGIVGADARMYAVLESGTYKVEVEYFDGCTSFSEPIQVYIDTTSHQPTMIREIDYSDIQVYPNPFQSLLFLDLSGITCQKIDLYLKSITGVTVLTKTVPCASQPLTISLQHLSTGMYILEIMLDERIYREKIIKQ